jgi:hypothetical protein
MDNSGRPRRLPSHCHCALHPLLAFVTTTTIVTTNKVYPVRAVAVAVAPQPAQPVGALRPWPADPFAPQLLHHSIFRLQSGNNRTAAPEPALPWPPYVFQRLRCRPFISRSYPVPVLQCVNRLIQLHAGTAGSWAVDNATAWIPRPHYTLDPLGRQDPSRAAARCSQNSTLLGQTKDSGLAAGPE